MTEWTHDDVQVGCEVVLTRTNGPYVGRWEGTVTHRTGDYVCIAKDGGKRMLYVGADADIVVESVTKPPLETGALYAVKHPVDGWHVRRRFDGGWGRRADLLGVPYVTDADAEKWGWVIGDRLNLTVAATGEPWTPDGEACVASGQSWYLTRSGAWVCTKEPTL